MRENVLKTSILVRMVVIAAVGILLLIPTLFVGFLISERQQMRSSAVEEVTRQWGKEQTITGPILTVPIRRVRVAENGEKRISVRHAHLLPENLSVQSRLVPEIRYRGIYRVVVYTASVTLDGEFLTSAIDQMKGEDGVILWDDAYLTVGVADLKGIKEIGGLTWNTHPLSPQPGLKTDELGESGFTITAPIDSRQRRYQFAMRADLRGSEEFRVVPAGRQTTVSMASSWGDPSFVGEFLPEKREIDEHSFDASWKVLDFNRSLPEVWFGEQPGLKTSSFGVKLLLPVDEYQKNHRAIRYAIMFIALTFITFFIVDVLSKTPFHPVHYTLVGFALVLFYVLLLSLSEYLPFDGSYWIAGGAIILLVGLYTRGVTSRWDVSGIVGSALLVLYAFLFVLLRLEDYALLLGSLGLFAVLALIMFLTRKIDWFGSARGTNEAA